MLFYAASSVLSKVHIRQMKLTKNIFTVHKAKYVTSHLTHYNKTFSDESIDVHLQLINF